MYNIGQFRASLDRNFYLTDLLNSSTGEAVEYKQVTTISSTIVFSEAYKRFSGDAVMNNQNSYYLRFSVMQRTDSEQTFSLKLNNSTQQEDNKQLIETYTINQNAQGANQIFFEIIISPNAQYDEIIWELNRTDADFRVYTQENGQSTAENIIGRKMIVKIYEFAKLINIVQTLQEGSYPNLKYLTKIGIQGPPALLTCINGQQIRLGRNGIYEINNGINVTSINFIPNNNDYFIMDFEY